MGHSNDLLSTVSVREIFKASNSGKELKVARRNGRINVLKYKFEDDGTGFIQLLDEYIETWREALIEVHRAYISTRRGKSIIETAKRHAHLHDKTGRTRPPDCGESGHKYVFVNSHGMPLTHHDVYMRFKSTTYKYLGVSVNRMGCAIFGPRNT